KSQGTGPVVQQKEISGIQRLATDKEDEKLGTNDQRMRKDKEIQEKPEVQKMTDPKEKEEKDATVQKMTDPEEKEEQVGAIQKMTAPDEKEEKKIQSKSDGTTSSTASASLSSRIQNSSGNGNHLPAATLAEMSTSFGTDLSHVNVHTGADAVNMSKELGAQAFTHGRDIYFNSGKYDPQSVAGKHLLAHELTHVIQQTGQNSFAPDLISRKINFDAAKNIKSVDFTVGAEISEDFCNLVQAELKKGKPDDKKIETFLLHLIKKEGTVSDTDRIFIASLYNAGFASKISSAAIKAGSQFSIKFKDIPVGKIDHIASFGRAAAGRGSINEEAPSDALDVNDRSAVTDVVKLITSIDPHDPLIEDLAHGRLKIDKVSVAKLKQISGNPDFLAFYSPVAPLSGLKGKTLYLPDNINMTNAYDRSMVIHELQHARDDLKAGSKITQLDSARLEFNAYVSQAKYLLDAILSAPSDTEKDAIASKISVASELVYLGFVSVALSNKTLYKPALVRIWNFAPAAIAAVKPDKLLSIDPVVFESKFIAAIQAGYKFTSGQTTTAGGGTDAETFVKWFPNM
ncbi:MAG: DUF4157 domain-containing protein, partial [Sediminibacterium sp.]